MITEEFKSRYQKKERVSFHAYYLDDKTNWNDFVAELERNFIDEKGRDLDIEAKYKIDFTKLSLRRTTKLIPAVERNIDKAR